MNERIKELEKQATNVVEGWSDENGTTRYYEFNREKFAQLIVLECVNAVQDGTNEGDHYAMRIESHFDTGQGGILHYGDEK